MLRYFSKILCMILIISGITFITGRVNASCGSANCFLVTGAQEGIATPGQIILDLSYRFIPMDQIQEGSRSASEALVPRVDFEGGEIVPDGHSEIRTNNELMQLDVSYGLNPKMALALSIPFFNLRTHEHAHGPGDFTRQDGTSGFGDVRLIWKYALWVRARHLLVAGLGVKTPTGEYKLLDHEGEINEATIQPGSGSWDGLITTYYAYRIMPSRLDAFLSGSYQLSTENELDYKFGDTLLLSGGVDYLPSSGERPLKVSLQVNMRQSPHDEFEGDEVPSTGGTWVYLTPGVTIQATGNMAFYTHVQMPVYQYVNETNIVPRYGLIFGISYTF